MKTLMPTTLPLLSSEVKELVRDGVYALYALRRPTKAGGEYLLVTRGREFYVLSSGGDVLDAEGASISDFDIATALTFSSPAGGSAQVNFG